MSREEKLNIIAQSVVKAFKDVLKEKNVGATGSLSNSIKYKVSPSFIEFEMNKYAEYVDKGTKPHMPPINKLKKWAEIKGLNVWAVARTIEKKGTKPHPFLYKIKEVLLDLDEELMEAIGIDIIDNFDKKFKAVWQ